MACYPKEHRLLNPNDFNYLKSGASVCNTSYLRFYFKDSRFNNGHSRLGLSVSKKVGNAVQRNRVKRILREHFRNTDFICSSVDILVIASPRLKTIFKDKKDVSEEIKTSWFKGISRLNVSK